MPFWNRTATAWNCMKTWPQQLLNSKSFQVRQVLQFKARHLPRVQVYITYTMSTYVQPGLCNAQTSHDSPHLYVHCFKVRKMEESCTNHRLSEWKCRKRLRNLNLQILPACSCYATLITSRLTSHSTGFKAHVEYAKRPGVAEKNTVCDSRVCGWTLQFLVLIQNCVNTIAVLQNVLWAIRVIRVGDGALLIKDPWTIFVPSSSIGR